MHTGVYEFIIQNNIPEQDFGVSIVALGNTKSMFSKFA